MEIEAPSNFKFLIYWRIINCFFLDEMSTLLGDGAVMRVKSTFNDGCSNLNFNQMFSIAIFFGQSAQKSKNYSHLIAQNRIVVGKVVGEDFSQ